MTTCYVSNYESIRTSNQMMIHQNSPIAATTPITPIPIAVSVANNSSPTNPDYTKPLHVDCSIEYELPNQAKPPVGLRNEPLLMIHPCYFRKIESQKRSPFINNLPPSLNLNTNTTSSCNSTTTTSSNNNNNNNNNNNTYLNVNNNTSRQQQAVLTVTNNTASQIAKRRLLLQQQQQQQQQSKPLQTQLQPQYSVQWEPQISTSISTSILPNNNYSCCNSSNSLITTTNSNNNNNNNNNSNSNNNNNNHWVQQKTVNSSFNNDLYLYSSSAVPSTGKYRQYSRSNLYHHQSHRLHPYMTSSIPLASTFPQMQQVCYNV